MPFFTLLGLALLAVDQPLSPEMQMVCTSLRDGERARVEKAVGFIGEQPLYRADFDFNPATRVVLGKVFITVSANGKKRPLDEIFLRAIPNANTEGAVRLSGAKINGVAMKLEQPEPSLYRVRLEKAVPPGSSVTLELRLAAKVPDTSDDSDTLSADPGAMDQKGGDYGAFSVSKNVSSLAGIVPMMPFTRANGALASGPSGIGDLGTFDPSNFIVSVTVPSAYRVVAAGNLVGELPETNGRTRFTYALAAAREFPLLVTRQYGVATASAGDIAVTSYFDESDATAGRKVLEHAANALRVAQEKLGPYPFKTLRVVQAHLSSGAGGMEFPGLITVATSLYHGSSKPLSVLGMPDVASNPLIAPMLAGSLGAMMQNTLEFTVDHEVAHQYIAMLVGNDAVDEPVADEPLTQALALMIMEWQHKEALASEIRSSQVKMAFQMMRMMGRADAKANRPTSEFTSNVDYAGLIYGKATLLFDAQRALVGQFVFERALRMYVDENRYKWVTPKTFTALLGRLDPGRAAALEKLRRRWWEEAHGDEDIGGFDLDELVNGMTTANQRAGHALDPKLLEQYNQAMEALTGEQ